MKFKFAFLFLFLVSTLIAQEKQTFFLKNGEKIIGNILEKNDSTGVYKINTSYGIISFNETDLKKTSVSVELKSGELIKGDLMEEDENGIKVLSTYGELYLKHDIINSIDFLNADDINTGLLDESSGRWYYGDERLIDIFFDPTGYTLENNILYVSGMSWGYGLTEKVQITSNWFRYFIGDLNIRPKVQIYRVGDVKKEIVASVGAHIHTRGLPDKFKYVNEAESYYYNDSYEYGRWRQVGESNDYTGEDDKLWSEVFGAVTQSNLRSSSQGRINYTVGASITFYPDEDVMPRVYGAITSDVRKKLKLLFELYYDPYFPSTYDIINEKKAKSPFGFDFGFNYAVNEHFRFGLHYQRPFIGLYYKF